MHIIILAVTPDELYCTQLSYNLLSYQEKHNGHNNSSSKIEGKLSVVSLDVMDISKG